MKMSTSDKLRIIITLFGIFGIIGILYFMNGYEKFNTNKKKITPVITLEKDKDSIKL